MHYTYIHSFGISAASALRFQAPFINNDADAGMRSESKFQVAAGGEDVWIQTSVRTGLCIYEIFNETQPTAITAETGKTTPQTDPVLE